MTIPAVSMGVQSDKFGLSHQAAWFTKYDLQTAQWFLRDTIITLGRPNMGPSFITNGERLRWYQRCAIK